MLKGISRRMPPQSNNKLANKLYSKLKKTLNKKPIINKWKWWKSNDDDTSSTHSTLDWRSLSPDKPPLPFFLPNESSPSSSTTDLLHQTTLIPNTDTIESNQKYTKSRSPEDRNSFQPLCPIMEESETIITNSSILTKSLQQQQDEPIISSSRVINNQSNSSAVADKPNTDSNSSDATTFSAVSSRSEVSATALTGAVTLPSSDPSPKQTIATSPLNEEECRRKFVKIILAANKYRYQKKKFIEEPTKMTLLFDANDNVETMCVIRQGEKEYHRFNGISQYIPPELNTDTEYHHEMVDVWVLGVHLYKLLLGQYPFIGKNDKERFKNMLERNFVFPEELSNEAKDLLKRMLAPDTTRASLNVVIFHPWLKSYREHLVKNCQTAPLQKKAKTNTNRDKKGTPPFVKSVVSLLINGPFPPPKKPYRDLCHLGTRESVFFAQF